MIAPDLDLVMARWTQAGGRALPAADAKALLADTARALVASNVALWVGVPPRVVASGYKLYDKQMPLLANAVALVRKTGDAFLTEEIFEDERIDLSGQPAELNAKGTGIAAVRFGDGDAPGVLMALFHRCPPLPFVEPGPPIPDATLGRLEQLAGVAAGLARAVGA